ncbi:class B sortase [Paenibacillus sp. 19GGS1-52]|uniref:class B sortase n=1 Tax=Paenibacillus sp. 19GGS1-52 TaxID=2758563 RepID=UPI001EFAC9D3|nr:class B sortase [Paenibacillus sp. 19GGS1-52]ULO06276.1 class B sortase [Paenibacillus sp. 19GGS1-52]
MKSFKRTHWCYLLLLWSSLFVLGYTSLQIAKWFDDTKKLEVIIKETNPTALRGSNIAAESSTKQTSTVSPYLNVDFSKLQARNEEIIAWIKIPLVHLDIPIVQTTDNSFYLTHDLDRQKNKLGWIFVDTRSNIEHMGMNTTIYGHNALNQQMFGSLKKLLSLAEGYSEDGELIQFTTEYHEMVFQICSVYVTDSEDWEYIQSSFIDDAAKSSFIHMIREKNQVARFTTNSLSIQDKFITLSTCYGPAGTTKRLVVQAKLIMQNE